MVDGQPPEPTKVMVNGAAVALLNSMFQSLKGDLADTAEALKGDIKDTENRLSGQIEERFRDHEQHHSQIRNSMERRSTDMTGRIKSLEDTRQEQRERAIEVAAKWWLPRRIAEFVARNHKAITLAIGALLGFLIGLSGHLTITL